MKKHLSLSQRIHNAEGAQAAEAIHARHSYLHAKAFGKEEWGEIWSRSDETSWAHAFGRWRGFDAVWRGNVSKYNARAISPYEKMFDLVPEIAWLTDFRPLNEIAMHTLATDIIEVADDGKTARAYFCTPGVISSALTPKMTYRGAILWERYGSDFICEDGEWKYLHEQVCPDLFGDYDAGNCGAELYQKFIDPNAPPPEKFDGGGGEMQLNDLGPLHFPYSPVQPLQNTVPWPVPYKTMDNDNTYTKKNE